jgi:uracil-DNA glycosylase
VFQAIAEVNKNCIYLLWGNHAKEIISDYIPESSVKLFTSSPFGFAANKGFIGCGHFKEVNRILTEKGMEPIEW